MALLAESGRVTYAELHDLVCRAAGGLRALGVRPEERVALVLLDSIEFVVTFLAAMRIGAIPLPLNPLLPAPDLALSIAEARARVLAVSAERAPDAPDLVERAPELAHVIVAEGSPPPALAHGDGHELRRRARRRPRSRRAVRHLGGLARLLALHVGHDGPAEARHAPPRRPADHGGGLRARGARDRARGSLLLGRPALPRLRPRQRARLPAVGRSVRDPGARPPAQGGAGRRGRAGGPADALLLRAHVLRRAAGRRSPRGHVRLGAARGLRRGGAPRRSCSRASASASASRSSTGSARRR